MVRSIILLCLLGVCCSTLAQSQYRIGLGTGLRLFQSRDQAASPLLYSGHGLPISLMGILEKEQWSHQVDLNIISSSLTNAYNMKSRANSKLNSWHWLQAEYSIFHEIAEGNSLQHSIGASLRSLLFYREYAHLDGYSWEAINGLYLNYRGTYNINRHSFNLGLRLPLIAYLHRPGYTADEEFLEDFFKKVGILKYGRFAFPSQSFWQFRANVAYSYGLTEKFSIELKIDYEQYQLDFPQKSESMSLQFSTHILFQF